MTSSDPRGQTRDPVNEWRVKRRVSLGMGQIPRSIERISSLDTALQSRLGFFGARCRVSNNVQNIQTKIEYTFFHNSNLCHHTTRLFTTLIIIKQRNLRLK